MHVIINKVNKRKTEPILDGKHELRSLEKKRIKIRTEGKTLVNIKEKST